MNETEIELKPEQAEDFKKNVQPKLRYAEWLKIDTAEDAVNAQKMIKEIKQARAQFSEKFDAPVSAAQAALKAVNDLKKFFLDPFDRAEQIIKKKCLEFNDRIETESKEAERKAEAERQKIENEKKAKLQIKIDEENRKIAAAKREEERIQAEKDAEIKKVKDKEKAEQMRKDEEARRARQASIDAEAARKAQEKATELAAKKDELFVPPVEFTPAPAQIKSEGVAFKSVWKGECANMMKLCESIVAGKAPVHLLKIDQSELNTLAKSNRNTMPIPGLRFYEEKQMSVKA